MESLLEKIKNKKAKIGVIGLGYVGLPLAVEMAKVGFKVIGIDVDPKKVNKVNKGQSYIGDVSTKELRELTKTGKLKATTHYEVLRNVEVVDICVPTPLRKTREPDISYILQATGEVARYLHQGQLIILESTTYPGTTVEVMLPMLERKGLKVGKDFYLAFSPERVDPGNPKYTTKNIPKVVGGVTKICTKMAATLYQQCIDKIFPVSSTQVAETVKLLENTFRSVNIGLVNEIAIICNKLGIDIWEVIEAAATKPFGFMPFYPGPGIGGHCLAKDEYIFVKTGNGIETIKIGDFVDDLSKSESTLKHNLGDIVLFKPHKAQTLSFDIESKTFSYKDIKLMSKRPFSGLMKEIITSDGRKITVTDKHPMLTYHSDNSIHITLAENLRLGDRIPISNIITNQKVIQFSEINNLKNSFATVEIKEIRTLPGQDVYSMEVADTNTFVTSYGIVTHNCIPLDPHYLSWKVRLEGYDAKFIELAGEINRSMPEYVVNKMVDALNSQGKSIKNTKIFVLGVAYKRDISDVRESPALEIIKLLQKRTARVFYNDPYIPNINHEGVNLKSTPLSEKNIKSMEGVIIVTNHTAYDYQWIVDKAKLVVDTRNATKFIRNTKKNIVKL